MPTSDDLLSRANDARFEAMKMNDEASASACRQQETNFLLHAIVLELQALRATMRQGADHA